MKKINCYFVGVVAFLVLVLFFVVAAFIGPEPKLKNSQVVKSYVAQLENLIDSVEAQNQRIEESLAAGDCQSLTKLSADLDWKTGNWQISAFVGLGAVIEKEGLSGLRGLDLPETIEQRLNEFEQSKREGLSLIRQRLFQCLDRISE